jgi:transposase
LTRAQRQAKARRLAAAGLNVREIAERLEVSVGTAHRDVNPDAEARYRLAERERKRRHRGVGQDHDQKEVGAA